MLSLGAVFLFAGQDVIAKYLTLVYPALLVVWARFAVQTALMGVVYVPTMGLSILHTRLWRLQLVRGLCMLMASICFVVGLRYVPVGEATAVVYLSPLLVITYSARVLKERIRFGQWLAVFCGLAGVYADAEFMAFAGQLRPMLQKQENQLMTAAPWGPQV